MSLLYFGNRLRIFDFHCQVIYVTLGNGGLLFIVLTAVCKNMKMVVGNFTAQEAAWKICDKEWTLINSEEQLCDTQDIQQICLWQNYR